MHSACLVVRPTLRRLGGRCRAHRLVSLHRAILRLLIPCNKLNKLLLHASTQLKASMVQGLLSDIPAAQVEAVLHHLSSQDHGSLRQVSRIVSSRTTQHIPYLILRLSSSNSMQHVQQWYQATQQLQHVSSIHVLITGNVTSSVFSLAMQLLSQRSKITRLHLLAADSSSNCSSSNSNLLNTARLPTLLPIKGLIDRLKALVICGIAVSNLANDLQQMAAAAAVIAGFQLQCLTIKAGWSYPGGVSWPEFKLALGHLHTAFPMLQQLQIKLPPLHYVPLTFNQTPGSYACSWESSLTDVAAAAAGVNAAIEFQHLEDLTVSGIYDIWKPVPATGNQAPVAIVAEATALEAGDDRTEAAAVLDSMLSAEQLPSVSAAAAAFGTLDDLGRSLLQNHAALEALKIGIEGSAWQMAWQQTHRACYTTAMTAAPTCSMQEIIASIKPSEEESMRHVDLGHFLRVLRSVKLHVNDSSEVSRSSSSSSSSSSGDGSADGSARNSSSSRGRTHSGDDSCTAADSACASSSGDVGVVEGISDHQSPMIRFLRCLSSCSSRPAAVLMRYISSCELELYDDDYADPLVDLLRDLKSLKHLEITLNCGSHHFCSTRAARSNTTQRCSPVTVVKAVAAVQHLKLLTVRMPGLSDDHLLPDDLLLPLTAAAGGPGSSLKKFHLAGNFASDACGAAAIHQTRHVPGFLHVLNQLAGVVDLNIDHYDDEQPCSISVFDLPASLISFTGRNLIIDSAAAAGSSSSAASHASMGDSLCDTTAGMCPVLQRLKIDRCQLCSPSILASNQLQQLTVIDSTWSGGWAAAAAAWPNVRQLVWEFDDSKSSGSNLGSTNAMQGICASFDHLGSLCVVVPAQYLCAEVLDSAVQYLDKIRYIRLQVYNSRAVYTDVMINQNLLQQKLPWASVSMHIAAMIERLNH